MSIRCTPPTNWRISSKTRRKAIFILDNFAVTLEHALPHLPDMQHIIVSKMGDFLGFKGRIVDFVLKYVKK